ncbi:hypothetical protein V6N12_033202 [Hibiscus sabdariffa]|uniref:PB1-like domain-containing protein n=2 Tax=Hibiscus sabdariffa TaxID=183260 RepID=A0ABR2BAM8_9ROSI
MTRVRRKRDKPDAVFETNPSKFIIVVDHGGSFYRTPDLIYTGQFVDYFDRCDVDEMSIFEMIDMVEKLGLTYTMKIFLLVSEKPFEVKLLASDNDVLEMVSKLPRNHYVHVYLEEVLTASSVANVEPEINVEVSDAGSFEPEINVEIGDAGSFEPRINVEVSDVAGSFEPEFNVEVSDAAGSFEPDFNVEDNDDVDSFEPDCNVEVSDAVIVSDDDSLEENIGELSEIRVESNSDSGDIDYEASKSSTHESGFIDSDAEASDDVSNVHARIRRPSQPTMHQDQSTAPSPRPNQSDIHPQSNIPRPSQPVPPPYTVRWMPTPTIPFTQEPHTASPSQFDIHLQRNIPRPSQLLPPPYTVRWMPTSTVPFTQESHTATPNQFGIHPQINIPRPSQPLTPPYIVRWMPTPTIPLTQESFVTQPSPQDLAEKRLRSDP